MGSNSKILLALLAGAAAGVAIGLLLAPEKGAATREKISDTAKKLADEILKKTEEAIDDIASQVKK